MGRKAPGVRIPLLPPNKQRKLVMDKKQKQLGMNPSTASQRLLKDLLFNFVVNNGHVCSKCGQQLTRDTFSVEHVIPWLDSDDPVGMYFDIGNIAYSHLACNIGARRKAPKPRPYRHGVSGYRLGCKCDVCKDGYSQKRRDKYLRIGT